MNPELQLKIILETPPAAVDYGIQKGSGSKYETIQKQRSVNKDLEFEFTITARNNTDASPDFLGACVQGIRNERFVYIDIGTYAGQSDSVWGRRLKIPLKGITREMIKKLSADPTCILETKVPGTGKDGGPNCATVKPFNGWHLSQKKLRK